MKYAVDRVTSMIRYKWSQVEVTCLKANHVWNPLSKGAQKCSVHQKYHPRAYIAFLFRHVTAHKCTKPFINLTLQIISYTPRAKARMFNPLVKSIQDKSPVIEVKIGAAKGFFSKITSPLVWLSVLRGQQANLCLFTSSSSAYYH